MSGDLGDSSSAKEAINGQKQSTLTCRERMLEPVRVWLTGDNWAPWQVSTRN